METLANEFNVAKIITCTSKKVEHVVGCGDNAGIKHFFIFPQCRDLIFLSSVGLAFVKPKATNVLRFSDTDS